MLNKDGLKPGSKVDLKTLHRIKSKQREALKNGKPEPGRGKRKAANKTKVRQPDQSSVPGVADTEKPKRA